jgi:hypothetical protein
MNGEITENGCIKFCPYIPTYIGSGHCASDCEYFQGVMFVFIDETGDYVKRTDITRTEIHLNNNHYYCIVDCLKENQEKITKLLEED